MKNTKRALLLSALALTMCVAMLIGSTFAWFTDSASTAVNTIQSGTLDIVISSDAKGDQSLEGGTLNFVKAAGAPANEVVLWEPNCTYNTQEFYIVNKGNLALKFQFDVTGAIGDVELLKVIDFTAMVDATDLLVVNGDANIAAGGEIDLLNGVVLNNSTTLNEYILKPGQAIGPMAITGHMDANAGNEYQGLTVQGLAVNLIATQVMYESDSFGNTYDKDADYLNLPRATIDKLGNVVVINDNDGEEFVDATQIVANWSGVSSNSTYVIPSPFTIDAAYNFKAPATVDPNFANWNADFVVSVDADIDTDSLILTGQYESFLPDTWVSFTNFVPVGAGDEIRLLGLAGQTWTYKDICEIVKEFKCGVSNIDVPSGVTFTVELKVFEVDANGDETGVSHTVAVVNHVF